MRGEATVLHADLDAFYASVEQRDAPRLRGRPVIVGPSTSEGVLESTSILVFSYSHCSLDGLIADEAGDFSWAFPPEDVHRAANEATAGTGIHLLGRRTYEVMRYWDEPQEGASEVEADFQHAWAPAQKVVYSRSIDEVGPNARIEREFDPASARALAAASDSDVAIGGADLGGQALRAGIVDVLTLVTPRGVTQRVGTSVAGLSDGEGRTIGKPTSWP